VSTPTGPDSDDFWAKRPESATPPQPAPAPQSEQTGQPGAAPPSGQPVAAPQPGQSAQAGYPGQAPAYPQPPGSYPPPAAGQPPGWVQGTPRNGLGVAALVLGILSLPSAFFGGVIGIILGVIGLILGIVGLNRARRGEATNRGVAITGTVLSGLGVLLGIAFAVLWTTVIVRYWECIDPNENHTDTTRQACFDRIDSTD